MSNLSNGNAERKVKSELKARWKLQNARCIYCHQEIDYRAPKNHPRACEAAHLKPVKTHPHLAYEPTNFGPSHSSCNRSAGDEEFTPQQRTRAHWG